MMDRKFYGQFRYEKLIPKASCLGIGIVNIKDVWDSPQNWSDSELLATEPYRGWDTGNVKTVALNEEHICTYYAGTGTTTGVVGVIVNNR